MPVTCRTEQGLPMWKEMQLMKQANMQWLDEIPVSVPESGNSCRMTHFGRLTSNWFSTSKNSTLLCVREMR